MIMFAPKKLVLGVTLLLTILWAAPAPAQTKPLVLWYDRSAGQWYEALALGNGRLGAMVFGGPAKERIQFNEDTFWAGGPYDPSHSDALKAWPKARRLILENKVAAAHHLIGKEMMARPLRQMPYQPVGDLILEFPGHDQFSAYRRSLDLRSAMATVAYRVDNVTYTRQVFSSPVAQVMVVRVSA